MPLDILTRLSPGSKGKSETEVSSDHTLSPDKWSLSQQIPKSLNDGDNSLNKADKTSYSDDLSQTTTALNQPSENMTTYCIEQCLFGGTGVSKTKQMLRCCVCMRWFHFKCVKPKICWNMVMSNLQKNTSTSVTDYRNFEL